MSIELIGKDAEHLKPLLKKYGKPLANPNAVGGWELSVTAKGGRPQNLMGTLNATQAAYSSIMKASIIPKAKARVVPVTAPQVKRAPSVMTAPMQGIEVQAWVGTMVGRYQQQMFDEQRKRREEEDTDIALSAAAAAQAAAARARTKIKQATMRKLKVAGRIRVHGYSRRYGKTVRDFKRRSPKRRGMR